MVTIFPIFDNEHRAMFRSRGFCHANHLPLVKLIDESVRLFICLKTHHLIDNHENLVSSDHVPVLTYRIREYQNQEYSTSARPMQRHLYVL